MCRSIVLNLFNLYVYKQILCAAVLGSRSHRCMMEPYSVDNFVKGKSSSKDSQLILRLKKSDRDDFVALCKEMDTSAAREVRGFIRKFIKKNKKKIKD